MFTAGMFVALGLIFTFAKLPWAWRLRILSHPVKMDLIVFAVLTLLHWGTFTGVMAATIGALTCSALLSLGRWAYGYMHNGKHIAGRINIKHKLSAVR